MQKQGYVLNLGTTVFRKMEMYIFQHHCYGSQYGQSILELVSIAFSCAKFYKTYFIRRDAVRAAAYEYDQRRNIYIRF